MMNIRKNRKIILLTTIITIELILIANFSAKIIQKFQILGISTSVSPMRKEELIFDPNAKLKYFYEPKPNTAIKEKNQFTTNIPIYSINDDALNERLNYSITRDKGTFRIVALGDSFTFGQFADTKNNYVEILEDKLNQQLHCKNYQKFEVINLGVKGYDLQYSVERFRLRGLKYEPDLVIWLLKDDDFLQVLEEVYPEKTAMREQMKKDGTYEYYKEKGIYYPVSTRFGDEIRKKYGMDNILKYQKNALENLYKIYSGKVLIYTFPQTQKKFKRLLQEVAINHPNTIVNDNLTDIYKSNAHFPDNHPNLEGYQLIANFAFDEINNYNLVSCN